MEILLGLATMVVIALALALAPGRWRRARPVARRTARPRASFLGVCGSCAEIIEADARVERCPTCGAELVVRQRIVEERRDRSRAPATR
jgi:predicted RNA-binding Zn-ribbon protein involved in translation (DUF1610 family)